MRLSHVLLASVLLATAPWVAGCQVDRPRGESRYHATYDVVSLQHATAADVAERLRQLGALERGGGFGEVQLAVDERTNSVLLNGQRGRLDQLIAVIRELDAPR